MLIPVPPSECMRAREAVSGRLDGELAELEVVWLDLHLRQCPSCREFADTAAAVAAELRRAPLERPGAPVFAPRPRRRVPALRLQAAAVALAAVAIVGSFALGRTLGGGTGSPVRLASAPSADVASVQADSLEQHLLAMLPRLNRAHALRLGTVVAL